MKYYVYTLAYPDGVVFYVGKGSGKRVAHHEQEALRGHNCSKCELIRSIWRLGGIVQRAIVFETEDERAALEREAALIWQYGPTQLVNCNQRGHGVDCRDGYTSARRTGRAVGEPTLQKDEFITGYFSDSVVTYILFGY